MNCAFSRDLLALHVEGDLNELDTQAVTRHLAACPECGEFFEDLQSTQSLLKTLRQETCSTASCAAMRHEVMSAIEESRVSTGWSARIERTLTLGLRRRGFAFASFAGAAAMVSVLLLSGMRDVAPMNQSAAVFDSGNRLVLPAGYRQWIPLASEASRSVYISPAAYREYVKSGTFPEGTVIVKESAAQALQVSVKDGSRFESGWGFFDFYGPAETQLKTAALADEASCASCHERNAKTDYVFTQFYPKL
jgi:cytochrome c553